MKTFSFLIVLLFSLTMAAWADTDTFYFYKEAGKKLERGARFGGYNLIEVKRKFPDLDVDSLLPKKRSNEKNELDLDITVSVHSDATYSFFIENLSVRNEQNIYHLRAPTRNITPANPRYRELTANESVQGHIKSKYEVQIGRKISYMDSFLFDVSPLPKRLFLDYKFRIRKEGGPEEVFEGAIPLELTSYTISLWEKIWR